MSLLYEVSKADWDARSRPNIFTHPDLARASLAAPRSRSKEVSLVPSDAARERAGTGGNAGSGGRKRRSRKWGPASRRTKAVMLGGAGLGGAGYVVADRRARQRKQNERNGAVTKFYQDEIYNPFEKAYRPDPGDASNVRTIACIVPTGRHVGRANRLVHVRNASGGGGRATRLERYSKERRR